MFRKLINLLRRERLDADIREELEFHRSQTAGSFGNLTSIQERTREASTVAWLETLLQDVRIAFRLMQRTPSLTAIALLSIALSVGATASFLQPSNPCFSIRSLTGGPRNSCSSAA